MLGLKFNNHPNWYQINHSVFVSEINSGIYDINELIVIDIIEEDR